MNLPDIPDDFKIEHDRLIYEMEPIVRRLFAILKSLPKAINQKGITEVLNYHDFYVKIEEKNDQTPEI